MKNSFVTFGLGKDFSDKTLMAQAINERKSYYINILVLQMTLRKWKDSICKSSTF